MEDPQGIVLVLKHEGREVERKAATAQGVEAWIQELTRHYGQLEIEYVSDKDAAMVSRLLSKPR